MAEDYVALLARLGIGKVTLVGWSDGAIIGLDIAIHHPKLLDRLFAHEPNVTPAGLKVVELADGVSFDELQSKTGVPLLQ